MRVLAIIVLLLGCSADQGRRTDTRPAATGSGSSAVDRAAAPVSCADRVARIDKELRALSAMTPGFLPIVNGIATPASTAGKPFDARGFVVAVTREGHAYVQGHRIEDTADARSYFRAIEMRAVEQLVMDGGSGRDAKFPLYIWADRETTAGAVAELLSAIEPEPAKKRPPQNLTKEQLDARQQAIDQAREMGLLGEASPRFLPRLLVAGTAAARRGPESADATAAAAKLPASEPETTTYLAAQLRGAIGMCAPLIIGIGTASAAGTPAKEADGLVASLSAGLKECECKIASLDVFEWGVYTWFGAWAPPLAWIDMPKLTAGDKQPVGALVK
jgi:hypothetical protein